MTMPAVSSLPVGAAVALTTATPANVASLVLPGGTYLVWGFVNALLASASLTALAAALSWNSGALSSQPGSFVSAGNRLFPEPIAQLLTSLTTASGTQSQDVGPTLVTIPPNTSATLYLVAQAAFSAGGVSAYGSLFAYPLPS